jgi:hypothetical protein
MPDFTVVLDTERKDKDKIIKNLVGILEELIERSQDLENARYTPKPGGYSISTAVERLKSSVILAYRLIEEAKKNGQTNAPKSIGGSEETI